MIEELREETESPDNKIIKQISNDSFVSAPQFI
jgi:hypothetical protein